jgi:hypothetical protein
MFLFFFFSRRVFSISFSSRVLIFSPHLLFNLRRCLFLIPSSLPIKFTVRAEIPFRENAAFNSMCVTATGSSLSIQHVSRGNSQFTNAPFARQPRSVRASRRRGSVDLFSQRRRLSRPLLCVWRAATSQLNS